RLKPAATHLFSTLFPEEPIVAIKRASGEMEFNPTSTSVIKQGDTLIAMGETKQLKALGDLAGVQ
ncbi:MAG: hypothetical protein ACC651_09970, partial [Candidatus Scalindua sp.]